jgi:hypothetical protein
VTTPTTSIQQYPRIRQPRMFRLRKESVYGMGRA